MQVKPVYGVSQGCNGVASPVARQVAPGPGVSTLSNLDFTRMRIVKRGCVVSYHGLRCKVERVRQGHFWGHTVDMSGRPHANSTLAGECRHVQVVA